MTSRELFEDYCFYRGYTAHFQRKKQRYCIKPLQPSPANLALFDDLIAWCSERQINPRHWLYSLFAVRKWIFAPRLQSIFLMSEKHIVRFRKFRDYAFYKRYRASKKPPSRQFDPNRDLSASAEQAKQYYLNRGQTAECMARMVYETFGYHPKSSICVRCVAATQCRATLEAQVQFDIMSLRSGLITAEEACQQAQGRGYGRR